MGLEVQYGETEGDWFYPTQRLYLTEDDKLVEEGDPSARRLFCIPGRRIPLEDATRYGLATKESPPLDEADPLVCEDCGKKAKSTAGLSAHRRAKHGG